MQTSVINYKDLNFEFRIDAEYYRAEILKNIILLDKKDNTALSNLVSFVMGPFGSTVTVDQYVLKSDYRYVRNKDINNFQICDDDPAYIPEQVYRTLPQFHIREDDLLITVVGTLGKVAIATKKDVSSIFSCKSTIIRANKIDPFYLLAYLNSNVGQLFALRGVRGAIQQGLNLSDLKEIKVFLPSENFQKTIRSIVSNAFIFTAESGNLYTQAEQILLSELGLLDWKPKHRLTFTKNFSDTQDGGRIDAEYYQPMYEEIIDKFRNNSKSDILENITKLVGHPSNPPYASEDSKNKTFIITQKHLGNYCPSDNFWEDEEALYTTNDFIKKNKQYLLQKNDIILYSVGAYIGKANIYNSDIKATIGSFLTLIRPDQEKVNPYYLLVFLNSEVGKQITRRCSRGMAQQYIYPFDIRKFVVPLISKAKQAEIEKKMLEALDTKTLSKCLLDIAKRGVEMAIEKSEKEAQVLIETELKKHDIKLDQIQQRMEAVR